MQLFPLSTFRTFSLSSKTIPYPLQSLPASLPPPALCLPLSWTESWNLSQEDWESELSLFTTPTRLQCDGHPLVIIGDQLPSLLWLLLWQNPKSSEKSGRTEEGWHWPCLALPRPIQSATFSCWHLREAELLTGLDGMGRHGRHLALRRWPLRLQPCLLRGTQVRVELPTPRAAVPFRSMTLF